MTTISSHSGNIPDRGQQSQQAKHRADADRMKRGEEKSGLTSLNRINQVPRALEAELSAQRQKIMPLDPLQIAQIPHEETPSLEIDKSHYGEEDLRKEVAEILKEPEDSIQVKRLEDFFKAVLMEDSHP